jgi:hypothetical protein
VRRRKPAGVVASTTSDNRSGRRRDRERRRRSVLNGACASGREAEEEAPEARAELNLRAELFIQQFGEDLKLQRLHSMTTVSSMYYGAGA